jgi:hypothetical protein
VILLFLLMLLLLTPTSLQSVRVMLLLLLLLMAPRSLQSVSARLMMLLLLRLILLLRLLLLLLVPRSPLTSERRVDASKWRISVILLFLLMLLLLAPTSLQSVRLAVAAAVAAVAATVAAVAAADVYSDSRAEESTICWAAFPAAFAAATAADLPAAGTTCNAVPGKGTCSSCWYFRDHPPVLLEPRRRIPKHEKQRKVIHIFIIAYSYLRFFQSLEEIIEECYSKVIKNPQLLKQYDNFRYVLFAGPSNINYVNATSVHRPTANRK